MARLPEQLAMILTMARVPTDLAISSGTGKLGTKAKEAVRRVVKKSKVSRYS